MDEFKQALEKVIASCSTLSEVWENIDNGVAEKLLKKYPFEKDFREVIHDLSAWKESLDE